MNPSAGAGPVFDRQSALERLGEDEELLREITAYFLEDSEKLLETIDTGAAAGDWPGVRVAAHSLKGLAANFSARPATDAARELEQAAAAPDLGRVPTLVAALRQEVERLRRGLTAYAASGTRPVGAEEQT